MSLAGISTSLIYLAIIIVIIIVIFILLRFLFGVLFIIPMQMQITTPEYSSLTTTLHGILM